MVNSLKDRLLESKLDSDVDQILDQNIAWRIIVFSKSLISQCLAYGNTRGPAGNDFSQLTSSGLGHLRLLDYVDCAKFR